jgi:hypothetical protein
MNLSNDRDYLVFVKDHISPDILLLACSHARLANKPIKTKVKELKYN